MYSFTTERTCPHCGADLTKPDTIIAGGNLAMLDGDDVVSEDGATTLILSDPEPVVTCKGCKGILDTWACLEE